MATLVVSRIFLNCSGRNAATFNVISRCWQQTYAACAPSANPPHDPVQYKSSVVPVFRRAAQYTDRIALRDIHGDYSYRGIFLSSRQLSYQIRDQLKGNHQERVAFLCPNDATYVITQWACWMSGQIAVPLSSLHPRNVLEYYIKDSEANLIVTTAEHAPVMSDIAKKLGRSLLVLDDALRTLAMEQTVKPSRLIAGVENDFRFGDQEYLDGGLVPEFYDKSDAMIIYTSGTTGEPKGVVLSHKNLESQVASLVEAWEWTQKDIILHVLPLHHMHGIVNALMCPLYAGARCVMLPKFEAPRVWANLLAINMPTTERVNILMAVPTIYMLLIEEYDRIFAKNERMKEYIRAVCSQKMRLMVSGSAPLPTPIFSRWEEITGHRILERYGMSETGMVLSNPLRGERKPGFVGTPLPSVEVQIARKDDVQEPEIVISGNYSGTTVLSQKYNSGELWVKGPGVFKAYYKRPKATAKEFTPDGWFKTGDTVQYIDSSFRILGRTSVDIIKTGGYKVSAIEVETHLLGHPDILDCAVVGLTDITWGQKVAAIVVPRENKEIILSKLREWGKDRMAPYTIPTVLKVVSKLPKNAMGKVNKKELLREIFPQTEHKA